jgi:hypothetical protein
LTFPSPNTPTRAMLIRRPQRPPVRSGRTELGPYASSRSSFPTSRRPSSSAGQVVQVPWSQPAVKLVGGGRQPLTPKGTLVLTRGQGACHPRARALTPACSIPCSRRAESGYQGFLIGETEAAVYIGERFKRRIVAVPKDRVGELWIGPTAVTYSFPKRTPRPQPSPGAG